MFSFIAYFALSVASSRFIPSKASRPDGCYCSNLPVWFMLQSTARSIAHHGHGPFSISRAISNFYLIRFKLIISKRTTERKWIAQSFISSIHQRWNMA
jgi:hypothetical protein